MRDMSKEMMKLGILNEAMDDSIESALGSGEDIEEMAQAEIDKILYDVTNGVMGTAPEAITDTLPAGAVANRLPQTPDDLDDLEALRARVDTIR